MNNSAIIGCGYWGSIIANNLREITKKKIYLYDKDKKNLDNLKKKIKNTEILNTIDDICNNKQIKNVFLITPPSQSYNIALKLIKYDKNVFIEKPGFVNLKQFNHIIKVNNKFKNTLMFGYVYLFNKYIIKIKNIIKKKKLGKILFIKSIRENLGPIRTDVDCNYDLASHDLSIISFLLNNNSLKINNSIKYKILNKKITDISTISLKLKNTEIEISTSWLSPEKVRKLIIIGSKKMLVFNEMSIKNKMLVFNQYANYPEVKKLNKIIFSKKPKIYKGSFSTINIKENKNPVQNEINHFFNCIKNKKKPLTNLVFSKKILSTLQKINKN